VVVTSGSSGGFLLSFLTLFDAGERVAIADPGYPCLRRCGSRSPRRRIKSPRGSSVSPGSSRPGQGGDRAGWMDGFTAMKTGMIPKIF
jgi:hypothetical protein